MRYLDLENAELLQEEVLLELDYVFLGDVGYFFNNFFLCDWIADSLIYYDLRSLAHLTLLKSD